MADSAVRTALWIGGICVAGLGVALYLIIGKSDSTPESQATPSELGSSAVGQPSVGGPNVTPRLPGEKPAIPIPPPQPGQNPRDYVVGDVHVRDHRTGDNKPLENPPQATPAESRVIPATLTHEVSRKVKEVMIECTKGIAKDARGDKPRVEGEIKVAIKDNKVTVTGSTMQLHDVTGGAVDTMKQCIETKSVGITNPAAGEADIDGYPIRMTFTIPNS